MALSNNKINPITEPYKVTKLHRQRLRKQAEHVKSLRKEPEVNRMFKIKKLKNNSTMILFRN